MDIPSGDGDRRNPGDVEHERVSAIRCAKAELGVARDIVVLLPSIVLACLADDAVSSYTAPDAYCELE